MPAKSKSAEEQQLRDEAMAEWLARGLAIEDFSMEKMLKLWDEEDGEGDEEDALDALENKQELMQGLQLLGPILEQAKDAAAQLKETVKQEAKSALVTAWKYAELPPLRRRRLLREHVDDLRAMDSEAHKYTQIRQRVVDEFEEAKQADAGIQFGLKKRNQRRAPLLHRTHEMRAEAEREKQARMLKDVEQKRQARLEKEATEKRLCEDEKERKKEQKLIERRQMNQSYWQKHLEEARAFSAQQALEQDRKEAFADAVEEMKAEIRAVEDNEGGAAALDMDWNETQSGLGVFGTAFEPGEWNSKIDGGHQTGMDEHTIGLFSARGFIVEHERKRVDLMEAQSKVSMLEEKLQQTQLARENLMHERRTIIERKNQHIQEIQVIASKYDELNALLAGPPRRDPRDQEKLQFHTLVTRRAQHLEHIKALDFRFSNIDKKMGIIAHSEATFGPLLTEAKTSEALLEQELADLTKDRHDLPMVVGKSIFQMIQLDGDTRSVESPGGAVVSGQHLDLTLLLNQVTMESKLQILKTAAPVDEHYKNARNAMIERWKAAEQKNQTEQDLEVSQTRLASIRDRLLEHQAASQRSDLMLAIQRFHKGPHKLRQCIFPIKGQIDWWVHRNMPKSFCVEWIDAHNGICRQRNEMLAKLTGSIRFPKRSLYRVQFNVLVSSILAAHGSEDADAERSPVDEWQLFIGADFDALQLNEFRDPAGNTVQSGELVFEFSGPRLCFSFEFRRLRDADSIRRSESGSGCHHLLLSTGSFEERLDDFREEEMRMRLIQREDHFVSELVKTLRLQSERNSSQRCAELLQELVLVEKSRGAMWDSKLFHGYAQRFQRDHYVQMLRTEIKKEIGKQIDAEIGQRKARHQNNQPLGAQDTVLAALNDSAERQLDFVDASRVNFQERKAELLLPHIANVKSSLGFYCSFKSQSDAVKASHLQQISSSKTTAKDSYAQAAMVVGIRYEWRGGRSKVHVLQKLASASAEDSRDLRDRKMFTRWSALDDANAVYLGSQCAKALQLRRQQEAQACEILSKNHEKIELVQQEVAKTRQEDNEILARETLEDEIRKRQQDRELARRELLFYADGMREATYNESVSAQIDFQVQRRLNSVAEDRTDSEAATSSTSEKEHVVRSAKEKFARNFMAGKLQLVKKTWQRKEKRIDDRRQRERKEREFLIRQEQQLIDDINATNQQELAALNTDQEVRIKNQLTIPNFQRAVGGTFECEHRNLKAWGSKYGFGQRCKACGKEMSESFDDQLQGRGADPGLDEDVRQHRAQTTSGVSIRFRDSKHLQAIENERVRLDKEARLIEESEAMLYDRVVPKEIDALNYRHGLDRKAVLEGANSDDLLYQRLVQDVHHASFEDDLLFHGRLRNFYFRIQQINEQHAHCTVILTVQLDFLDRARLDSSVVQGKLPMIERDYGRSVTLLKEDAAALSAFETSKTEVTAAMREREAAHHAIEGVEEEAEFVEFHAPSLVKSSDEMAAVCARFSSKRDEALQQLAFVSEHLERIKTDRENANVALRRLKYRSPKTIVHTRFGAAAVQFYREEDECLVVDLLDWEAVVYIPIDEVIAFEDASCEEERAIMAAEDACTRQFYQHERNCEKRELSLMEAEERDVRFITAWRLKKEAEEERMNHAVCKTEVEAQLEYEMEEKTKTLELARREANKLLVCGRVAFDNCKRRKPGRLDLLRAARACEKRLAMAAVEEKLLRTYSELQRLSEKERDDMYVKTLSTELLLDLTKEILTEVSEEVIDQERYKIQELERDFSRKPAIAEWSVQSDQVDSNFPTHVAVGLNRLWVARRKKWSLQFVTWKIEMRKLRALRQELTRREELRRTAEEERLLRERHQREMLAEERLCRIFYLEEIVLCMQERKAMASAEAEMRDYLRKLKLEAMKTKYAKMVEDRNRMNDKAARRLEIKMGKNEQHRLHREWAQIKVEDAMATQIRERELAEAQAEALERQFDRFLIEQAVNGRISTELEASRVKERLKEAQRVAEEKRTAFQTKLEQERMMATVETLYAMAAAELKWMNAMERMADWRSRAKSAESNLQLMAPQLRQIMDERTHVVADAVAKRKYADKCKARVVAADAALSAAVQKRHVCEQIYKKIHRENASMESSVLHDRVQLFNTFYIRDQLHERYFALLVDMVVRQAVVVATEREVARLQEKLRQLSTERAFKVKEVGVLQRKRRRENHMRLRRAELGALMFGRSRRRLLKERFQQWVELWSHRTVVRASFELKHKLLLQERRLLNKDAATAASVAQALVGVSGKLSLLRTKNISGPITKLSVLHDHQKRRVQCRLCKMRYSEEQNNRFACTYHPGTYEFACVRSCPTRSDTSGKSGAAGSANAAASVSPACMMHRTKRWLCCDETDEGRHGSTGCERRFHLPVRDEPAMVELVAKKSNHEMNLLEQVNQQLLELRERDLVSKVQRATKTVVSKMEQELADKRAVAAKYHTLDRRS